jgi:O-antigen/teichoic acid export membrane protein
LTTKRGGWAGNVLWLLVAEATGKVASFAFIVIVARGLGVSQYGAFAFAISFVAPFYRLASWGVDSIVISDVARDDSRIGEIFPTALFMRAGFGAIALGVALSLAPLFIEGPDAFLAFAILGVALLCDELSNFLGAVFRSFERMEFHALVLLANRLLSVALALVVFGAGGALIAVCFTYLAGSAGALAFGTFFVRRFLPPGLRMRPDRPVLRAMLRSGAALGLASAINMVTFRLDTVMLQAVKGTVAVGQYAVAYRFFESFAFVGYTLGDSAMPRLARQGRGKDAGRTFMLATALVLAFYLPLAIAYGFAGEWIVVRLFTRTYEGAAPTLAWLGGAGVLYGLAYVGRVGAIALGRRNEITAVAAGALVLNLGLNAYAIPRWGGTGAGAATFATEVFEVVLLVGLFLRTNRSLGTVRPVAAPVVAAALTAACLAILGLRDAPALLVGTFVYLVSMVVVARVVAPTETAQAVALVRRRLGRTSHLPMQREP